MPAHIQCDDCGIVLLAFRALGETPIGRDECPRCDGVEFTFLES